MKFTTRVNPVTALSAGRLYEYVLHEHDAERAGRHLDLRLGDPKIGLLSWAVPQGRLPEPGEKFLAVLQPVHPYDYGQFEGEIREGYGKGQVRVSGRGKVLVTHVDPANRIIAFTDASSRYPQRYALVRPASSNWKEDNWLLINATPRNSLPYEKDSLPQIQVDRLPEYIASGRFKYVQPKIDGALALIALNDDVMDVYSHRISRVNNRPIVHTERIYHGRPRFILPARYNGSILLGEIYGVYKDKEGKERVIPPNVLSAILNSSLDKAIARQIQDGIELRIGVFDARRIGSNVITYDVPYEQRRELISELLRHVKIPNVHLIEHYPAERAEELYRSIEAGKHPLTQEGVVLYPERGVPAKLKTFKEVDVYIRRIEPGKGKYANSAGGFAYSREPNGPIVGVVGTGFDDEFRKELAENPEEFIGRRARIKYFEEYPSGALRGPVFIALHEDYPNANVKAGAYEFLPPEDPYWLTAIHKLMEFRRKWRAKSASLQEILDLPALEYPSKAQTRVMAALGGPNPLLAILTRAAIGAGLAYAGGKVLQYLVNEDEAKTISDKFPWRLALLGGLVGSIQPIMMHALPNISEYGISGLFRPSALQKELLKAHVEKLASYVESRHNIRLDTSAIDTAAKDFMIKYGAKFDVDQWGKEVLSTDELSPWEKTMLVTVPLVTSVVKGDDSVTVGDVARTAANMGLGRLYGDLLGRVAVPLLGLDPSVRNRLRTSGELAGLMKSVVQPVRANLLTLARLEDMTYEGIRKALQI